MKGLSAVSGASVVVPMVQRLSPTRAMRSGQAQQTQMVGPCQQLPGRPSPSRSAWSAGRKTRCAALEADMVLSRISTIKQQYGGGQPAASSGVGPVRPAASKLVGRVLAA